MKRPPIEEIRQRVEAHAPAFTVLDGGPALAPQLAALLDYVEECETALAGAWEAIQYICGPEAVERARKWVKERR